MIIGKMFYGKLIVSDTLEKTIVFQATGNIFMDLNESETVLEVTVENEHGNKEKTLIKWNDNITYYVDAELLKEETK